MTPSSDSPPVPNPDDKDWTWTLQRACLDCGFDAPAVDLAEVPALTLGLTADLARALDRPDTTVRPAPTTWSPLEYGCHVRDVCTRMHQRLLLMLTEEDPLFENWDQDETAWQSRYWEQEPAQVRDELTTAARSIAGAFAGVTDEQRERPGRRSNGSVFTVTTLAQYFLHDLAHHVWDVRVVDAGGGV